jgi:hypothetical protein
VSRENDVIEPIKRYVVKLVVTEYGKTIPDAGFTLGRYDYDWEANDRANKIVEAVRKHQDENGVQS